MFRPNLDAKLRAKMGRDLFGKEAFADAVDLRCAIVNLDALIEQTSVRADSTASRGAAQEEVVKAKILVPAGTNVRSGDVIIVMGVTVEVTSKMPRVDTQGNVDHIQLAAKIRQEL